ncbi:MAG: hypothetical protein ABIH89_05985 [Elusimicrobiota bacterium]
MKFLSGEETANLLQDMISRKKQVGLFSVDLTVKSVYSMSGEASLDFGGSEYAEAFPELLEPVLRDTEDKYGWWTLEEGAYLFDFNERIDLSRTLMAVLQMHPRMLMTGAYIPLMILDAAPKKIPLYVFKKVMIKQNARISEVRIYVP